MGDMDDLLDQMESDLIKTTQTNQPPPLLPPTSIAMQPRGLRQNPAPKSVVTVSKFVISDDMNKHMEGHVSIDSSLLPNTFQSKPISQLRDDEIVPKKENILFSLVSGNQKIEDLREDCVVEKNEVADKVEACTTEVLSHVEVQEIIETKSHTEVQQEEDAVSEVEEETLIPETQVISNLNATAREAVPLTSQIQVTPRKIELDTEMESMLDYLNGVEDESDQNRSLSEPETQNNDTSTRKAGGRDFSDESSDESILFQYADKISEEVMTAALGTRKLHYDPAVQEFYHANDSIPDVFAMSFASTTSRKSELNNDTSNQLSGTENKQKLPSVVEQAEESEKENEPDEQQDNSESDCSLKHDKEDSSPQNVESETVHMTSLEQYPEVSLLTDVISVEEEIAASDISGDCSMDSKDTEQPVVEQPSINDSEDNIATEANTPVVEKNSEEKVTSETVDSMPSDDDESAPETVVEAVGFKAPTTDEEENREDADSIVESVSNDSQDSLVGTTEDETENRPRFDSSIATVHVLHESDSDESQPRRERRLTESELQLGKTSPYWIPDSECQNCMLCNVKFTIITRRHHCRACGRVLCGSCCSEKSVLDYLKEDGKKPQAVRVCKPCSTMLSRIESHEEEERRRLTDAHDRSYNEEDTSTSTTPHATTVPRGVLKARSMTQTNEEEGPSTSSQVPSSSSNVSESAKRSVVFRDGVRPGAPADEQNPEEERSTALKPKKKSRKRTAVVRRIAELKMEDELACALPKEGVTKLLIVKPDSEQPKFEDASVILEALCDFTVVTVVLKKNLNCTMQIFNNPNFGLVWAVSSQGFAQIGLDELFFSWTLSDSEKQNMDSEEPELDEKTALSLIPLVVLHRISMIYCQSTEHEYAGVRRVDSRLMRIHTVTESVTPLPKHVMFFRPTVQSGLENMRIPTNPFLIACFLHDDELSWATALPNRLLYKLGEKYNVFPTPFVNFVNRPALYSTDASGTVLKVFTDFRSWSYRMRHIPGCTVSLTNEKTIIRIPKSCMKELKEIITFSRSMVAWSCDMNQDDDSVLVCEETDPGLYSTQVFAKYMGQRESTSASFLILDGGSKVNSLQVNVVEDGVAIRLQSERLEVILNAINEGNDVMESSKDMEFRVEFVEDGDWIVPENEFYPKSQIDGLVLINKFQYGLSLERALTQVLQVQGISEYGIRMSHVYNLGDGRLQPEEEPKIYGLVEIAAKECVAMLEPHILFLIHAGIQSVSIRLFVSPYEFEYDVSKWIGLEAENDKYKQSLDQLIPMLYNMVQYVPNGFEVEFVLSIVSTRALPI
ncbi:hypothetical protein L3Y34_017767 [Caenorhabditis briggsae]|uniref:FYVE-type domain-containing protein n=2 Tax=Caenorhabditis briggsae TaxID=6238 RepID=A0AAE9ITV1_CAEBR|nr:hypothetical protein L3Y34_017767 [Caenorhabditis briggsae]